MTANFDSNALAKAIHAAVRQYEQDTGKKVAAAGIALRPPGHANPGTWSLTLIHKEVEPPRPGQKGVDGLNELFKKFGYDSNLKLPT